MRNMNAAVQSLWMTASQMSVGGVQFARKLIIVQTNSRFRDSKVGGEAKDKKDMLEMWIRKTPIERLPGESVA